MRTRRKLVSCNQYEFDKSIMINNAISEPWWWSQELQHKMLKQDASFWRSMAHPEIQLYISSNVLKIHCDDTLVMLAAQACTSIFPACFSCQPSRYRALPTKLHSSETYMVTLDNFSRLQGHRAGDVSFKGLSYQISTIGDLPTMLIMGSGESGFDSRMGAWETATTIHATKHTTL